MLIPVLLDERWDLAVLQLDRPDVIPKGEAVVSLVIFQPYYPAVFLGYHHEGRTVRNDDPAVDTPRSFTDDCLNMSITFQN